MNSNTLISFRLLCLAQRASMAMFGLGAALSVYAIWSTFSPGLSVGGIICVSGLAVYLTLAVLQMLVERRLLFVACPLCGARSNAAAWTTSFQCDCPRCSRVYASGIFHLQFFSPRRAESKPANKDC